MDRTSEQVQLHALSTIPYRGIILFSELEEQISVSCVWSWNRNICPAWRQEKYSGCTLRTIQTSLWTEITRLPAITWTILVQFLGAVANIWHYNEMRLWLWIPNKLNNDLTQYMSCWIAHTNQQYQALQLLGAEKKRMKVMWEYSSSLEQIAKKKLLNKNVKTVQEIYKMTRFYSKVACYQFKTIKSSSSETQPHCTI